MVMVLAFSIDHLAITPALSLPFYSSHWPTHAKTSVGDIPV